MFCGVLWPCYLIFALSFFFCKAVGKGNPTFSVKFYNSLKHIFSVSTVLPPSLPPPPLPLCAHCSPLHLGKREISVIIRGCFSYSCCLSYRNRMYSQDIPPTRPTAAMLQVLHFAFQWLLKCHKHECIYRGS